MQAQECAKAAEATPPGPEEMASQPPQQPPQETVQSSADRGGGEKWADVPLEAEWQVAAGHKGKRKFPIKPTDCPEFIEARTKAWRAAGKVQELGAPSEAEYTTWQGSMAAGMQKP